MDVFRNIAVFVIGVLLFSFNWNLHVENRGVLLYATEAPDKWNRLCHYYTPVRMFTARVPIQLQCAPQLPSNN